MSGSEPLSLELEPAAGTAPRIEWDVESLRQLGAAVEGSAEDAQPGWRLATEPDWDAARALSLISASFEDGALLAVAALRPREAEGHDADAVEAVLISAEGDVIRPHEVLLSVEYGPDGSARRLGLELYEGADGPPIRVAADRVGTAHAASDGAVREQAPLRLRMEGTPGAGLHELVHARDSDRDQKEAAPG
jgi:hypothetical protein